MQSKPIMMKTRSRNGAGCRSIPYETIRDSALYINSEVLADLGIELPEELAERGYTDMAE